MFFGIPSQGFVTSCLQRFPVFATSLLLANAAWAADTANDASSDEARWLAHFQSTYIWQKKSEVDGDYTGTNSLYARAEKGYTFSGTAFLGARLWQGAELYANPEVVQGVALSHLTGLGGFTNGEAQKVAGTNPKFYRARLFVRQTVDLGGDAVHLDEGFNQFAGNTTRRRFVVTLGNFAMNDVFDNNRYAHDPRTQFLNWSLMDMGAWDFAADSRGFTRALALEWFYDDYIVRFARALLPIESNGLQLNPHPFTIHADNAEIEHAHTLLGEPGKVRLLAYRNTAIMGSYSDAIQSAALTSTTPDITQTRERRNKVGYGVNVEQALTDELGSFARYSWNDGQEEAYCFTEIDRSLSAGVSLAGKRWSRPDDNLALAVVRNDLSAAHRDYLANGGLGYFLGDGKLNYHSEDILETYYNLRVLSDLWTTLDYQYINAPGYNADRGPVSVISLRVHFEY